MGQKINPTAYRLAIKQNWYSLSIKKNPNIFDEYFIRSFIHGMLLAWNYLSSQIIIKHYPGQYKIILLVYNLNTSSNLNYIKELMKSLLEKKYNKNFSFLIRETSNITTNSKILGDWLSKNISNHPTKIKTFLLFKTNPSPYKS